MNKKLRANILLFITALIWGFAFSAQSVGANHLSAWYFNGIRFCMGSLSLVPLIVFMRKRTQNSKSAPDVDVATESESTDFTDKRAVAPESPARAPKSPRASICSLCIGGTIAGVCMFAGASMQQLGIETTTAANAGFITGLYIIIVPLAALFLKKTPPVQAWLGVVLGVCGLYLLCINGSMSVRHGDVLMLIGSFFWAAHILLVDFFSKKVVPIELAAFQFAVCGVLSLAVALFQGNALAAANLKNALVPLLYGGLCSVGIAYTLQVIAQKDAEPTEASLILSLETVFSAVGGYIILGETLSARALTGCALIFAAIILAQLKPKKFSRKHH